MSPILIGSLASLLAGLATGIGAVLVFFIKKINERLEDLLLGTAAGVMLAASFFSLILPALEAGNEIYHSEITSVLVTTFSFLAGAAIIWLINEYLPHEHFVMGHEGGDALKLKKIWLFIIAITIHNFPEGMAVGVAFGGKDLTSGIPTAIGIGLQNIPEGLAVALALVGQKYKRNKAFLIALITGLIEPIGGILGISAVSFFLPLLPIGLAFAAGAMIFIISHEIVPETHRRGHHNPATVGLLLGFAVMMILDVVFG